MPSLGLTLAGFLEPQQAVGLLRRSCVFEDTSDAALTAQWQQARHRLGAPMHNAGQPDIHAIPAEAQACMAWLEQQAWVAKALQGDLAGAVFRMVGLDPLLAFQFSVDLARSAHHAGEAGPPSVEELLNLCLPADRNMENVRVTPGPNSLLVTSKGLNFVPLAKGLFRTSAGNFVGIQVGASGPLMHVVRYNGRHYLLNGFNRAVGLRRRGVTHAPCVLRDVATPEAAGILPGHTFDLPLLESADPPTVGHFTQGRAHPVQLKSFTRTLHVSWAECVTTQD